MRAGRLAATALVLGVTADRHALAGGDAETVARPVRFGYCRQPGTLPIGILGALCGTQVAQNIRSPAALPDALDIEVPRQNGGVARGNLLEVPLQTVTGAVAAHRPRRSPVPGWGRAPALNWRSLNRRRIMLLPGKPRMSRRCASNCRGR